MDRKKIRVAMVAPYPAQMVLKPEQIKPAYRNRIGHAAPWVRSLTTALIKRDDIEFHVFTHSRAVARVQHGEENGVPFTVIPQYEPGRVGCWHLHLPARIQFRKHIKQYKPDLVHGFGTESAYGLIAADQPVPTTLFIQGIQECLAPYYEQYSKIHICLRKALERRVVRNVSGLIGETIFAETWGRKMNPRALVTVIPHAVNHEFYSARAQFSDPVALCIGSLKTAKAVDVAIRAVSLIGNQNLRLAVIGSGRLMEPMKKLTAEIGVEDRVDFYGHLNRRQIIEQMSHSQMLLILSRMDTSPNILTEAHAAGLPVIGTRAGGIPDMIEDGKDGFLVDVDDAEAVAEKMDLLAADVELCRKMGAAGREKVKWLNDPDRIADLHVQFYRQVLDSVKLK